MTTLLKQRNLWSAFILLFTLAALSGCLPGWDLPDSEEEPVEEAIEEAVTDEKPEVEQPNQKLNPPSWILGTWGLSEEPELTFEFKSTTLIVNSFGFELDFVEMYRSASATFTERFSERAYAIIAQFPEETEPVTLEFELLTESSIRYNDRRAFYGFQYPSLELQRIEEEAKLVNPSSCLSGQVDINTAPREELKRIIHIDEVRSAEMILLRPFSSLEDLTRIKGIAEARLRDIIEQGIACISHSQ